MLTHEQIMQMDTVVDINVEYSVIGVKGFIHKNDEILEDFGVMTVEPVSEAKFTNLIAAAHLLYVATQQSCVNLQKMIDDCETTAGSDNESALALIPFFTKWMEDLLLVQRIALVGANQAVKEAKAEQKVLTASKVFRNI